MMKLGLNLVSVLLLIVGGIWFLQGIGVLPGSFMSGDSTWAIIGVVCILAGVGLFVFNRRGGRIEL